MTTGVKSMQEIQKVAREAKDNDMTYGQMTAQRYMYETKIQRKWF